MLVCMCVKLYYTANTDDLCTLCILQDSERTALNCASEEGYLEIVKNLIQAGATVDLKNKVHDSY